MDVSLQIVEVLVGAEEEVEQITLDSVYDELLVKVIIDEQIELEADEVQVHFHLVVEVEWGELVQMVILQIYQVTDEQD